MSSNNVLLNGDHFESISSTNLTIKSTLTSLSNQTAHKSISKTTKTISPQPKKQQSKTNLSKTGAKERSNSCSKRQERGSAQSSKDVSLVKSSQSDSNELKQVFAKLQSKSVAQKLHQHLVEEKTLATRPIKEKEDDSESVDGSTSASKSENL